MVLCEVRRAKCIMRIWYCENSFWTQLDENSFWTQLHEAVEDLRARSLYYWLLHNGAKAQTDSDNVPIIMTCGEFLHAKERIIWWSQWQNFASKKLQLLPWNDSLRVDVSKLSRLQEEIHTYALARHHRNQTALKLIPVTASNTNGGFDVIVVRFS